MGSSSISGILPYTAARALSEYHPGSSCSRIPSMHLSALQLMCRKLKSRTLYNLSGWSVCNHQRLNNLDIFFIQTLGLMHEHQVDRPITSLWWHIRPYLNILSRRFKSQIQFIRHFWQIWLLLRLNIPLSYPFFILQISKLLPESIWSLLDNKGSVTIMNDTWWSSSKTIVFAQILCELYSFALIVISCGPYCEVAARFDLVKN